MVFQNLGLAWFSRWHYAVATGYDFNRRVVVLHTGAQEARAVAMATAVALEELGQYEEAAAVYAAVVELWPRRLGGWIGLANAWYRLDQYRVVEEVLRSALEYHPLHPYHDRSHGLGPKSQHKEAVAMRKVLQSLISLAVALALAGPVHAAGNAADEARAVLKDAEGAQVGEVRLLSGPNGTLVQADLEDFPEGEHAFHVHAVGRCTPPFKSAGGHFNPGKTKHGFFSKGGYHVGDMPNIHVPASGALKVEAFNPRLKLGEALFDEDGAALVIHKGPDDYRTDPAGAAGPRIACGVIRR